MHDTQLLKTIERYWCSCVQRHGVEGGARGRHAARRRGGHHRGRRGPQGRLETAMDHFPHPAEVDAGTATPRGAHTSSARSRSLKGSATSAIQGTLICTSRYQLVTLRMVCVTFTTFMSFKSHPLRRCRCIKVGHNGRTQEPKAGPVEDLMVVALPDNRAHLHLVLRHVRGDLRGYRKHWDGSTVCT